MEAATSSAVPHLAWGDTVNLMDWRPGEHVTLIGPTGRGKTETLIKLMEARRNCLFLSTKRKDDTQDTLRSMGFRTIQRAVDLNPEVATRYTFKPPFPRGSADDLRDLHRDAFSNVLIRARWQRGYTIGVDEARYIAGFLGLTDELQLLLLQGRSEGTSMVINTQRPRYIPLEAYDQATHLLMWSDPDLDNVSRVSQMAGLNRTRVLDILPNLPKHDVLYINTVTGDLAVTNTRW